MKTFFILFLFLVSSNSILSQANILCDWSYIYDMKGYRIARVQLWNCGQSKKMEIPEVVKSDSVKVIGYSTLITLFPNPTYGEFFIDFDKEESNVTFNIIDNSGKLIKTITSNGKSIPFDISQYTKGTYHIYITTPNWSSSKIVVKE